MGWDVELIATPVNYLTGTVPRRYRHRASVREEIDGIPHHWVWAHPSIHRSKLHRAANYLTFAAAAALAGANKPAPDVIWASSPPLPVASAGRLLSLRYGRPWIYEVRDLWPESAASVGWLSEESALYRALDSMARGYARNADSVMVPTPGLVEPLRRHGARHVDVITGVVLDGGVRAPERSRLRGEWGVGPDTCLFVYVGALGVANGLEMLLDAVTRLPATTDAAVVMVGHGSDSERLKNRLAGDARLLRRVRIMRPVPKERVPDVLAAGDVCLHLLLPDPLFETALPNKILEAFAARRPFITTVPGLPARLAQESGSTFAPDAALLADAMESWARMGQSERARRGEASHAYGISRFGLPATVRRLNDVLLRVARRGASSDDGAGP
jgi:colanic acid biosynthesis glycosyl transferase WcaI